MRDGLSLSVRSLSQKEYALAIEWMEVAYELTLKKFGHDHEETKQTRDTLIKYRKEVSIT